MTRLIPALCALVALLLLAVHPAGMASAMTAAAPVAEAASPCHGQEAAQGEAPGRAETADPAGGTAQMDCCSDGLCTACTPVAALSGAAQPLFRAFVRAGQAMPAGAALPPALAEAPKRPPRPTA